MQYNSLFPKLSDSAYQIEAELDSGGGGVVYKAWHSRLQKYVVLKRIKEGSGILEKGRQRDEVDILKNLKHANLPQIYDFLADESGVYTVMEFIQGESFAALLKSGDTYTEQQIIPWAAQLADALKYLHSQKPPIIHGDIKPGNIMLMPNGEVCLIDFNISFISNEYGSGITGLSPGYASPEQLKLLELSPGYQNGNSNTGDETVLEHNEQRYNNLPVKAKNKTKNNIDTRSDIYSFGAVLYSLATGEKPAITKNGAKPLNSFGLRFSDAFVYIIERCIKQDPDDRFQTAAELYNAIININETNGKKNRNRANKEMAVIIMSIGIIAIIGLAANFIIIPLLYDQSISILDWLFSDSYSITDKLSSSSAALSRVYLIAGIKIFWYIWTVVFIIALFMLGRKLQTKPKPDATDALLIKKEPYYLALDINAELIKLKQTHKTEAINTLYKKMKTLEEKLSAESDFGININGVIDYENKIAKKLRYIKESVSIPAAEFSNENILNITNAITDINGLLKRRQEIKKK